jgi:diacylglycerol kinase (ATP)
MKVLFILNPSSGNTGNEKTILRIHELAIEKEFDFKFLYTNGRNDDERIGTELRSYQPDRVIAGGGDGTVQLVARNLIGRDHLMGIIPMGSANGMATALGLPPNPVDAATMVVTADHCIPLDLLKFNDDHICIHLGDIGINALMVKKYEEDSQKGMLGYAKYLLSSIKETPLLKYSIKTPDQVYEREGYMLAFANAHQYGTGVHISQGEVWDGKFEIVNVPRVALDQVIKAGLTALNVFVDKDMFSDVISCTDAEVTIDQEVDFQIDGEYMGKVKSLKVAILPGAVKLLIP